MKLSNNTRLWIRWKSVLIENSIWRVWRIANTAINTKYSWWSWWWFQCTFWQCRYSSNVRVRIWFQTKSTSPLKKKKKTNVDVLFISFFLFLLLMFFTIECCFSFVFVFERILNNCDTTEMWFYFSWKFIVHTHDTPVTIVILFRYLFGLVVPIFYVYYH